MKRRVLAVSFLSLCMYAFGQQSNLSIGWPEEGFYTTEGTFVVPLDTTIHFNGISSSTDVNGWKWELPGATPSEVEGQTADVVYNEEGTYDVKLQANVNGESQELNVSKGLSAGGAHYVWNISKEEQSKLKVIPLAWYGWYGGTNTLGMIKFAEYFHSPMGKATIDSVEIFFGSYKVATKNAIITLSINVVDENGMPGEELGTTTILAKDIVKSTTTPTVFIFDEPINVNDAFFVTIGGFPNASNDGIAMKCLRRNYEEKCTAYHLVEDEDQYYNPLGTYTWYKNVDDPTSFAISPHLNYLTVSNMVGDVNGDGDVTTTDISMMVSHILGITDSRFILANAETNDDGVIDINDIMNVVSIILGK